MVVSSGSSSSARHSCGRHLEQKGARGPSEGKWSIFVMSNTDQWKERK